MEDRFKAIAWKGHRLELNEMEYKYQVVYEEERGEMKLNHILLLGQTELQDIFDNIPLTSENDVFKKKLQNV